MLGSAIVDAVEEAGGIAIATTRSPGKIAALNQEAEQHQKTRRFAQLDFADEAALKAGVAEIVSDYVEAARILSEDGTSVTAFEVQAVTWCAWRRLHGVTK